jgi:hypothetical protein
VNGTETGTETDNNTLARIIPKINTQNFESVIYAAGQFIFPLEGPFWTLVHLFSSATVPYGENQYVCSARTAPILAWRPAAVVDS